MKTLFFCLSFVFSLAAQSQTTLPTTEGPVLGVETSTGFAYKGIPYARPPVGDLRWAPPQPPLTRQKLWDATDFGSICPQVSISFWQRTVVGSEDCLRLNIWKPRAKAALLPVMVFIHGGANIMGAGNVDVFKNGTNLYDGEYLSSLGAVIVTLNYRLGSLGFMAHPALSAASGYGGSGNYGVLDQIQALKWVQQNIKFFGGDPAKVTVFGESAGAIDILGMIASPLAKGLFAQAIVESGFLTEIPLTTSEQIGLQISKSLACDSAADPLICLRSKSSADVISATGSLKDSKMVASNLTIDNHLLKSGVLAAFRSGAYNSVPLIIGSNADEMTTLAPALTDIPKTADEYEKTLKTYFGEQLGQAVLAKYPPYTYGLPSRTFEVLLGDAFVHCPTRQVNRALNAHGTAVWRYVFSHASDNPVFAPLGAGHALELPYVFHSTPFFASSREEQLSRSIAGYWSSFAKNGVPAGTVSWPVSTADQYLNLDVSTHADQNYRGEVCDFWDQVSL